MQKWEYKLVYSLSRGGLMGKEGAFATMLDGSEKKIGRGGFMPDIAGQLNKLAEEGWEVVSTASGGSGAGSWTTVWTLKRPKKASEEDA